MGSTTSSPLVHLVALASRSRGSAYGELHEQFMLHMNLDVAVTPSSVFGEPEFRSGPSFHTESPGTFLAELLMASTGGGGNSSDGAGGERGTRGVRGILCAAAAAAYAAPHVFSTARLLFLS
ncbi:hypothetical protein HYPSUDRAFT_206959 [Hypholoma sublateritium FD-334 SS-4]|uniref:Uncharacterized protein n=1 Tax=Hypholoma sublateritium (strain FD-334 SS-4) TaxID=945553 RepID=A0A0D2M043_HYPSF|nr:hypothetical protein HYPSUDRAFT_206959 [Hypholoma sublateritium FD-334 SS-4]